MAGTSSDHPAEESTLVDYRRFLIDVTKLENAPVHGIFRPIRGGDQSAELVII